MNILFFSFPLNEFFEWPESCDRPKGTQKVQVGKWQPANVNKQIKQMDLLKAANFVQICPNVTISQHAKCAHLKFQLIKCEMIGTC